MIRLYVPDDLAPGPLAVTAEQARYLTQVMRRTLGDEVALFNGRDGEWRARLAEIGRRGCVLTVETVTRVQAPAPDLTLLVAMVKRSPLETIVEKATELGAGSIRLVTTRRTNAERANLTRLSAIATEAAEQSGRLEVPAASGPEPLGAVLDAWDGRPLIFCDEGGDAPPMLQALQGGAGGAAGAAALLIGPEGGFAPEERARLRSLPFVTPVSIGPRILRADTAGIVALTLWQATAGRDRDRLPAST